MKRALATLRLTLLLVVQIALLWFVNWFSHLLVGAFRLPLPGNVAAVLILFALLQSGVVPLAWVERGATLLLRHLGLFFLPIAVGLMTFAGLWATSGASILAILVGSAIVGFAVTGRLCQWLMQAFSAYRSRPPTSEHEPDPYRP